jgi:hypothetical protein
MAITVLPKTGASFTQASTSTDPWLVSLEVGAYSWNAYDFEPPAVPALGDALYTGAVSLKSLATLSSAAILFYLA